MNKLFIVDVKHKLETQDIFRGKTVRTLIAEIDTLNAELALREIGFQKKIAECKAKDELLDSRAGKLLKKGKFFLVVACDEPYFKATYDQIKLEELFKGTWTAQDEQTYQEELSKAVR